MQTKFCFPKKAGIENKQGRKRPLDTPKRKIERRERRKERRREREKGRRREREG